MEILIILLSIIQAMAISLGVGSSTLAVINFFVAISDGTISPEERRLMGVVYIVLRVAMVLILCTTLLIALLQLPEQGLADYFTSYKAAMWTLIAILYANATLMTLKMMSSTFGPAIQASSWYTLGIITTLLPMNLHNFTYLQFILSYLAVLTFAVVVINLFILKLTPPKQS